MRIATWNVNSLKARLEKVGWWLKRAQPDVLLMQETKLADADAPHAQFAEWGYALAHHGQGRWNGVAIASRAPAVAMDVVAHFGEPFAAPTEEAGDEQPLAEARILAARVDGVRVISIYAPNGRTIDSPHYAAKLAWFDKLAAWLDATRAPGDATVLAGDFNVAPADLDVWDPAACQGGTHVTAAERAAWQRLCDGGLVDVYRQRHPTLQRFSWWDYRAGNFHKNVGMRIDHCLVSTALLPRVVGVEIDREARKGKPTPSDHAPVFVDLDTPGVAIDAGWKDR